MKKVRTYPVAEMKDYFARRLEEEDFSYHLNVELHKINSSFNINKMPVEELYQLVIKNELIEKIVAKMAREKIHKGVPKASETGSEANANQKPAVPSKVFSLSLSIHSGKGFNWNLLEEDLEMFILVDFLGQRFTTRPVPCSSNPEIGQKTEFSMHEIKTKDILALSQLSSPMRFAIFHENNKGERITASVREFEWRFVLTDGKLTVTMDFNGMENASDYVIGQLQVTLELLPKLAKPEYLKDRELNEQISFEKKSHSFEVMKFFEYSSKWWEDFKAIHQSFQGRAIRIYAHDEFG